MGTYVLAALHSKDSSLAVPALLRKASNIIWYQGSEPGANTNYKHNTINALDDLKQWIAQTVSAKLKQDPEAIFYMVMDVNFGFSGYDVFVEPYLTDVLVKQAIKQPLLYTGSGGSSYHLTSTPHGVDPVLFANMTNETARGKVRQEILNALSGKTGILNRLKPYLNLKNAVYTPEMKHTLFTPPKNGSASAPPTAPNTPLHANQLSAAAAAATVPAAAPIVLDSKKLIG